MYILIAISFFIILLAFVLVKTIISNNQTKMNELFKSMSFDIIQKNNQSFLGLAKATFDKYQENLKGDIDLKQKELESVINPVKESLDKIEKFTKDVEKERHSSYTSLNKQLDILIASENHLRKETANLVNALKSPNVRGAWGQIHLKRVLELAGLLNNCDFFEQETKVVDDKMYRPDLIVKLPGKRHIIIDAKTPLDSYLEAQDKEEYIKEEKLKNHTQHLKKHIKDLAAKQYFSKFDESLEYVILFLPAEAFLTSAIKVDPNLLEIAASKNIILATPTTLIAILKAIAQAWKQDSISKNSEEIAKLGKEMYERLSVMNAHFSKLGKNLSTAVDAYNQAISSLNTRVLVSAKKLKDKVLINNKEDKLLEVSKTCSNTPEI